MSTKVASSIVIKLIENNLFGLRILCYHSLSDFPQLVYPNINTSISLFKRQMEFLKFNNYTCLNFDELHQFLDGKEKVPEKSFIITFDDGFKNVYTHAFPVLEAYDYYGILFVPTNFIGGSNIDKNKNKLFQPLSEKEIHTLSKSGRFLIGSHGCSHTPMTNLENQKLIDELKFSKNILENIVEKEVVHFAFPNGRYNPRVMKITASIYKYVYSTKKGLNREMKNLKTPIFRHSINDDCSFEDFVVQMKGGYDWIRYIC